MRFFLCTLLLWPFFLWGQTDEATALDAMKAKPGFVKLLPRGQIAAIYEPTFVTGQSANMPLDAWVIGIAAGDEAKAYSINLLNKHEIVNDFIGDKPIATTW